MIESRLLSAEETALLLHPERWEPVFCADCEGAIDDGRHMRWLQEKPHSHAHPEILLIVSGGGYHAHGEALYPCPPRTSRPSASSGSRCMAAARRPA
jgi:hypothetical protein